MESSEDFEQLIPGSRVFSNKPISLDSDDDDVIILDDVNDSNNEINLPEARSVNVLNKQYPAKLTINQNDLNKLIIYTNKEGKQIVYYNGHTYVKMDILVDDTLPNIHVFKCNLEQCPAIIKLSDADPASANAENRVFKINQHNCERTTIVSSVKDFTRSDLFKRVKVVSYFDPKRSFKALRGSYNLPDLVPTDSTTVVLYFNEKDVKLIYYMGYEYCYRSKRCYKINTCEAKLLFFMDKLKVYEIGKHTCVTDTKNQYNLIPTSLRGLDDPKYTPVRFVYHFETSAEDVVPKLDPYDQRTVTVYWTKLYEKTVKTIYYRGYLYLDEGKRTLIYMCARSKKCSGVLGVKPNKNAVSEIVKHTHCQRDMTAIVGFKPNILRKTFNIKSSIQPIASTSSLSVGKEAYQITSVKNRLNQTLAFIKNKDGTATISNTTIYEKDGKRYKRVEAYPATLSTLKQLKICSSVNKMACAQVAYCDIEVNEEVKQETDEISFDYHEIKQEKYENLETDDNFKINSIGIVEEADPVNVKVESQDSQVVFNPFDVLPRPKIEGTESLLNKIDDAPLLFETLTASTTNTIQYNRFSDNVLTRQDKTICNTNQKFTQKNIKKSAFKNFGQINSRIKQYSKDDEHGVFFYVDDRNRKIICYRGFTYFYDGRVYMCTNLRCAAALNEIDDVFTVLGVHNCTNNHLGESTESSKNAAIEELFKPYTEKIKTQDTKIKLAGSIKRKQNFDNNLGESSNTSKKVVISPNIEKTKTQVTVSEKDLGKDGIVLECLESSFVDVPLNEQSSYTHVNKQVIQFRGYKHRWFQRCKWLEGAYVYLCLNNHLCQCDGIVILKDGKIIKSKDHICRGTHGMPDFDANEKQKPTMYYSFTRRRRELFYKGYIYLALHWTEPRFSQWVCSVSELIPCLKIRGSNIILVKKMGHVCHLGKARMPTIKKKTVPRRIKHYDLIPAFDAHDNPFLIYEGFMYEKEKAIGKSKWICIKNKSGNCPGELTVDRHNNTLASLHSCCTTETIPDYTEEPSIYYSGTKSLPKRFECLMFGGYFYQCFEKELKMYHHWHCIYNSSKYLCPAVITCKHDKPIAVTSHSCKQGTTPLETSDAGQSDNVIIRTEVDKDGIVQAKEIDFGEFGMTSDENELSNIIEIEDESYDDNCEIAMQEEIVEM